MADRLQQLLGRHAVENSCWRNLLGEGHHGLNGRHERSCHVIPQPHELADVIAFLLALLNPSRHECHVGKACHVTATLPGLHILARALGA